MSDMYLTTSPSAGDEVNDRLGKLLQLLRSGAGSAPRQLTGTPSNFTVQTADQTVFTLAAGEIGFIQNLDSADALAVKLGAGASTTSLSFIIAAMRKLTTSSAW